MFDRLVAPPRSRPSRSGALICLSVAVHVAAALALTVMGMWPIDKLRPPDRQIVIATPLVPAPPRYEEPAPPATHPPRQRRSRAGARRPSAPVRHTADATAAEVDVDISLSAYGGPPGDSASGDEGFGRGPGGFGPGPAVTGLPIERLEPPPPAPTPREVPARVLDGRRIAGNAHILPSPVVQASMARAGQDSLRVPVEMCLTSAGDVRSLDVIESSGYEAYDRALLREMRRWRYEPYRADGMPIPVCTVITFIYHLQ